MLVFSIDLSSIDGKGTHVAQLFESLTLEVGANLLEIRACWQLPAFHGDLHDRLRSHA